MSGIRRAVDRLIGDIGDSDRVVVFDALGTLFDLSGLDERFTAAGSSPSVRTAWFSRLLDSARVLTMIGEYEAFDELARSTLRTTLAQAGLDPRRADEIADGLADVGAYPDAEPALERLANARVPAVVLTNGGKKQTEQLLEEAGLADGIRHVFSTEEVEAYKPDPRPYRLVHEQLGLGPDRLTLIAAHGWDVLGARAAGLGAIWVERLEIEWPFPLPEPELSAPDLISAATTVAGRVTAERS